MVPLSNAEGFSLGVPTVPKSFATFVYNPHFPLDDFITELPRSSRLEPSWDSPGRLRTQTLRIHRGARLPHIHQRLTIPLV